MIKTGVGLDSGQGRQTANRRAQPKPTSTECLLGMGSLVTGARKVLPFIAVGIDGCVKAGRRADCRWLENEMRWR